MNRRHVVRTVLALATGPNALAAQVPMAEPPVTQVRATGAPVGSAPDLGWALAHLDGRRTSLDAYRGRVLVVNLWAAWCEPCVAELASLHRLSSTLGDTSVAILLVAAERESAVRPFLRRRGVTLPVLLEQAPPPAAFGEPMLPTTWIIDRTGRIVHMQRGARAWDDPAVVTLLRTLASAPAR